MAAISPVPKLQFFAANGTPLVGGKLYAYAAGTTTPLATYTDAGGGTANPNPVVLDSRGEASVWLGTNLYKLRLTTATDVEVWTVDNVGGNATLAQLAASGGSALIGFLQAGTNATARTVQSKLRDFVSVKDFGAIGNGSANDTAAFTAALAASKRVYVPAGTYLVDTISLLATSSAGFGYTIIGESTTDTVIKGSASAVNLLSVVGSGIHSRFHTFENFTLDMSLMTNAASRRGIYLKTAWGMTFRNVNIINSTATQRAVYFDNQVYTTVFDNCDFGSELGVVEMQGLTLSDAVTTITYIGCSFGKMIADQVVSITLLQPIVQGNLDKFVLSNVTGFTILGGDIEGAGTYLALGSNVKHLNTLGNEMSGFSGTFSTGTFIDGVVMDQYGSTPFLLGPNNGTTHTGTITEKTSAAALVRKLVENTNAAAQTVDIQVKSAAGSSFFGQSAAGVAYVDGRGSGAVMLQASGVNKLGATATDRILVGTLTASSATAGSNGSLPAQVAGYIVIEIGGTPYKVPYYSN